MPTPPAYGLVSVIAHAPGKYPPPFSQFFAKHPPPIFYFSSTCPAHFLSISAALCKRPARRQQKITQSRFRSRPLRHDHGKHTSSTYSNSRVCKKSLKASLSVQLPHNACCSHTPELTSAFARSSNWSGFTCSRWHKIS